MGKTYFLKRILHKKKSKNFLIEALFTPIGLYKKALNCLQPYRTKLKELHSLLIFTDFFEMTDFCIVDRFSSDFCKSHEDLKIFTYSCVSIQIFRLNQSQILTFYSCTIGFNYST